MMLCQQFTQTLRRSRLFGLLAASAALLTTGATLPTSAPLRAQSLNLADLTIVIPSHPVIVVPSSRHRELDVTVRFIAQGDDWASIYLDGHLLFRANNTRRDYTVSLHPGAYYLEVAGVTSFDVWDAGYLDVGRNAANVLIVHYGKDTGVQVGGDPHAWLPD